MTYASEMYSWYAGSVTADTYFCPERQGTCFGSFYLKDWPAMVNPNYNIDEQLTARAGEEFLAALTDSQAATITGLVDLQRADLYEIVARREDIATQLRRFPTEPTIDSAAVMELSDRYGELDGELVYFYATRMAEVGQALSPDQRAQVIALADSLGYLPPPGGFLYSRPIPMPEIPNTDFLFGVASTDVGGGGSVSSPAAAGLVLRALPNPSVGGVAISLVLPKPGSTRVAIHSASGRMVSVLAGGHFTAGAHQVWWGGSDDAGRLVPAGIYFARVETAAGTRSLKITLRDDRGGRLTGRRTDGRGSCRRSPVRTAACALAKTARICYALTRKFGTGLPHSAPFPQLEMRKPTLCGAERGSPGRTTCGPAWSWVLAGRRPHRVLTGRTSQAPVGTAAIRRRKEPCRGESRFFALLFLSAFPPVRRRSGPTPGGSPRSRRSRAG